MRVSTERGPLIVLATVIAMLFGIVVPASAQFFPFGFQQQPRRQYLPPQQQQRPFFGDFFAPFGQSAPPQPQQQAPPPRVDYSRAPPPKPDKNDSPAERHVLVLGDAMADWLAYGLEDAFSEQSDLGVIRKHRTVSGLLRYQPRGEPSDWMAAAKGIIAQEPSDLIVVMLGLHDRTSIREAAVDKSDSKKDSRKKADGGTGTKPEDAEAPPADEQADNGETPSIAAPERTTRAANGVNEFRSERWTELYKKKIDDMIGVLKTKNVPVVWVGLPALRGQKSTSDMLFLNALYREGAARAGITYVDVWDGFVDEAGRFVQQGPDFEGQTRRLRTADGVFFTRPGARKLAHYVDREIQRLFSNRAVPVALPSDPGTPDTSIRPGGGTAPRPLAGPIVPLVAATVGTTELLGGAGSRPPTVDALAARILIKGEPLAAPGGRADDFSWPRREIGKLDNKIDGKDETPVAAGNPATTGVAPAAEAAPPKPAKRRPRPPVANTEQGSRPGFSGGSQRPAPPSYRPAAPRPPAPVGRSASAPGFFGNPFTR